MKRLLLPMLALQLLLTGVQAQVVWKHTTSDVWINPETSLVDSANCFTALSCYGDNCTAAAIRFVDDHFRPTGIVFYRSNDGGMSWFEQPHTISNTPNITSWGISGIQQIDSLNAVAFGDYGVIFRTTNAGIAWFRTDCPYEKRVLDIHFSDPLTGIMTCVGGPDSNLFTTTDGGIHWVTRAAPITLFSCHSYGNGKFTFYKYGFGPLYFTHNNFNSIDSLSMNFNFTTDTSKVEYIASLTFSSDSDFIIASGSHWEKDSSGKWWANAMVIRSTDGGKSWGTPQIFPRPELGNVKLRFSSLDRDTIFGGGGDFRHYIYSTDRGRTWAVDSIIIDTTYETARCYGMQISSDGHPIGIFGPPGFLTNSIITRGEYVPAKVEFIQKIRYHTYFYPNPSLDIVNIESILKDKSHVSIVDIFGREVANGMLLSEGKATLDLSPYPPGIYSVVFDFLGRKFIAGRVAKIE